MIIQIDEQEFWKQYFTIREYLTNLLLVKKSF